MSNKKQVNIRMVLDADDNQQLRMKAISHGVNREMMIQKIIHDFVSQDPIEVVTSAPQPVEEAEDKSFRVQLMGE